MAKARIDKELIDTINKYIAKISEFYTVEAVYLFGSFAKGTTHEWSDIDIAIVSKDISNRIKDGGKLFSLTWGIDTRIEPHPFHTDDFNKDESMLVDEILRTGIKVA